MSAPQYFLSKVFRGQLFPQGKLAQSVLASRGLAGLWSDCTDIGDFSVCEVMDRGPDGGPGIVVSALPVESREPPRRLGYRPEDAQQWVQVSQGCWIGIDAQLPPTPADLARRVSFAGYRVTLGDGNGWVVPVLREPITDKPLLPEEFWWDESGAFQRVLRKEYESLWERVLKLVDVFLKPGSNTYGQMDREEAVALGLEILGLNYRIGRGEQRVLRLINSTNWDDLLFQVVDGPLYVAAQKEIAEAQKKSASAASPPAAAASTPGSMADSPSTDPVSGNSTSPDSSKSDCPYGGCPGCFPGHEDVKGGPP